MRTNIITGLGELKCSGGWGRRHILMGFGERAVERIFYHLHTPSLVGYEERAVERTFCHLYAPVKVGNMALLVITYQKTHTLSSSVM